MSEPREIRPVIYFDPVNSSRDTSAQNPYEPGENVSPRSETKPAADESTEPVSEAQGEQEAASEADPKEPAEESEKPAVGKP